MATPQGPVWPQRTDPDATEQNLPVTSPSPTNPLMPLITPNTRNKVIAAVSASVIGLCVICSCAGAMAGAKTPSTTSNTSAQQHQSIALKATNTTKPQTSATATIAPTSIPTTLPTNTPVPVQPTATPKPYIAPTATPKPAPKYPAINGNPYDYTFTNTGHLLYSPAGDVCNWLNCIASFWTSTNGYVDECVDGTFSHSGGRTGACSHHGGELRPVYQP